MEKSKQKNLNTGKSIWELFMNGESKQSISVFLKVNRTEVSNVIKYTTPDMYNKTVPDEEKNIYISQLENEIQKLKEKITTLKNSELDIYKAKVL